jgi:hypothetical protein
MSIILHVSKLSDSCNKDDTCEVSESTNAVNIPRFMKPNKNDLSAIEISIASSKYTDDILSNLSFESKTSQRQNELENEFILQNQNIDRASLIEQILSSKDELGR